MGGLLHLVQRPGLEQGGVIVAHTVQCFLLK